MVFFHIIQSYEKNTRIYLLFLVVGRLERPSFIGSVSSPSIPTRVNLKRQYTTLTHYKTSALNADTFFNELI